MEINPRTPTVLGKPHKTMLDCIVSKNHLNPSKTCMVGDRIDTDIIFGLNGGMKTLLVLTGVTNEHEARETKVEVDYCIGSLGDLI